VLRKLPFTRQQALEQGWTERKIRSQLERGAWIQLTRGRYVETATIEAATPDERPALRAIAVAYKRELVVHRDSAACVHGLRVLTTPGKVAARHTSDLPPGDVTTACGVKVTDTPTTVIDVARFRGIDAGLVVADHALGLRRTTREELCARVERLARCHGREAARIVASEADGRAESAFESVSRYRLLTHGLPRPQLQAILLDYRVDFLWPEHKVIGEADGLKKYGNNEREVRAKIRAERFRQRVLEDAGYVFVRWLWDEIWNCPDLVALRIKRKLAERVP
jgi:very-short-patch-repair endonuclease